MMTLEKQLKLSEELRQCKENLVTIRKEMDQFINENSKEIDAIYAQTKNIRASLNAHRKSMVELKEEVTKLKEEADFVTLNKELLEFIKK